MANQKIVIKGKAGNLIVSKPDSDYTLKGLDKSIGTEAECHDNFSDYIDDISGVSGGKMTFVMEDDELQVVVEYESTRELSADELHDLIEYTSGQLSDGIGEGFEQFPFKTDGSTEYYLSPWYRGQVLKATQTPID